MYLVIFEGEPPKTAEHITDSEFTACDDGYLEIIDITDSKNPKCWHIDSWIDLEKWGEH